MRSLLVRIFLSFWLIIGVTIGTAALAGFWYAERVRDAFEEFDLGDTVLEASAALDKDGRDGLLRWLKAFPKTRGLIIFVIDSDGNDILNRRLPWSVERMIDRHRRHLPRHDRSRRDPHNLLRARPLTQLVSGNGETYSFVVAPFRDGPMHWRQQPGRLVLLFLALVVSAAVSYLLARAITRPVGKLRGATVELAAGKLDTRVSASVGRRRDELGMLARDFDQMAEKLQRASAQQTELSRNISHELRSPLSRLRVALELARRRGGELSEFDKIELEAERLDKLIGQILSYTRFESTGSDEKRRIDLAELIGGVVEDVNYECKSSGVDGVSVTLQALQPSMVDGYADALTSAIENVLRNAVHHSPADSEVAVSLSVDDDGRSIIAVSDSGTGVDQAELANLFDPFFRTRKSSADAPQNGTGLGLAIARRAVQLNGGEISAANSPDGGLTVSIRLPPSG